MKRKIELGTAIFLMMACTILACLITYTFITSKMTTVFATVEKYSKLSQVEQIVASRYIMDSYDEMQAMDGILKGFVAAADPYGKYMDAAAYQQYQAETNGKYAGLGITVRYISSTGNMKVTKVNRGSSADSVGVKAGDIVYKIDGVDVTTMSETDAQNLLKGKAGTTTVLSIYRNNESLEKEVTYSEYTASTVSYAVLDSKIGYIRFDAFDTNTASEFKKAYNSLVDEEITSIIFDVRNNSGGTLESVCTILDAVLPKGNIVTVTSKSGTKTSTIQSNSKQINLPIAVLINENTYSGAELFAAAIRDYKKGTLVGVKTFGKGVAQQIIPLGDQTAVYLSTQLYYPPSGESFDGVGVSPDVQIAMSDEDLENFYELTREEDIQLQKAIETLENKK
ncbi:MAG: S41 family peptidase [Clostridia bacterium]|nr:S41 family peptidase [Clostridia bacterium]